MGQQQLLLIILGVIIVGIAIAVGLSLFSAQSINSNRDAIINDLNNLFAQAYQHRIRPAAMGGGSGSYTTSKGGTAFAIPGKMSANENASYTAALAVDDVTFTATSAQGYGTVKVKIDADGRPTGAWTYTGSFQ